MNTKWMKIVVVVAVFLGAFSLKNISTFVDKAYGTETSLRDQARSLVRDIKAYKEREKTFDDKIANKDITHEERADVMNKKHKYIEDHAQALLTKTTVYIEAVKAAHEADSNDIEAKLQSTIETLTTDISGQNELAAKAVAEDGVQIVEILDDLRDSATCPTDPATPVVAKVTEEPAKDPWDDSEKLIEAKLWEEVLDLVDVDFSKDLDKDEMKALKHDITQSVTDFIELYFAEVSARAEDPFNFNDIRSEKNSNVYYNPERQLQKVSRVIKELEKKISETPDTDVAAAHKLQLRLFTARQLKSYFAKYSQVPQRGNDYPTDMVGMNAPSLPGDMGGIDSETMAMLMMMNGGQLSAEDLMMLTNGQGQGQSAEPKTGFGLRLGSTPYGGVNVGMDYKGQDFGYGMNGSFDNNYGKYGQFPGMFPSGAAQGWNPYVDPRRAFMP